MQQKLTQTNASKQTSLSKVQQEGTNHTSAVDSGQREIGKTRQNRTRQEIKKKIKLENNVGVKQ